MHSLPLTLTQLTLPGGRETRFPTCLKALGAEEEKGWVTEVVDVGEEGVETESRILVLGLPL